MHPTSAQQHRAAVSSGVPQPEQIAAGLWSVPIHMPGGFLRYSLSVVHMDESESVTVVDPGWGSAEAVGQLEGFLRAFDRSIDAVSSVIVTHSHPDHIGMAALLRARTRAELSWSRIEDAAMRTPLPDASAALEGWGVPDEVAARLHAAPVAGDERDVAPVADRLLEHHDVVDVGPYRLRAILTPGHTPGHLCFVEEELGIVFTGDHVLPTVFPGIGLSPSPGEDPVRDYLHSLDLLAVYDDFEVVPGHGYRFRGLGTRRRASARHVIRRGDEVEAIVNQRPTSTTWEIASQLTWTGGWDQIRGSRTVMSALSQTEAYRTFVRRGAGWPEQRTSHLEGAGS